MSVPVAERPSIVVADSDPRHQREFASALHGLAIQFTESGHEALALARLHPVCIILGPLLQDMQPFEVLTALREFYPVRERVYAVGTWSQDVDDVYYTTKSPLQGAALQLLVTSMADPSAIQMPPAVELAPPVLRGILDSARRLAVQQNMAGTERVLAQAAQRLTSAERASCLFHDEESGVLWRETEPDAPEIPACRSASGFAARSKLPIRIDRGDQDPRYHHGADNPAGDVSDRVLLQPIVGPDGEVHAVLSVSRRSRRPPFGAQEIAALRHFAEHVGPLLQGLSLQVQTQAALEELEPHHQIFRADAVNPRTQVKGEVLRITPPWIARTYWFVLLMVLASAIYMVLGTINQYSTGTAVVRFSGTTEVPATVEGTVTKTLVTAGQRVERGHVLARLHDAAQRAELDRLRREFERNVAVSLQDPANAPARRRLGELRAAMERAQAAVDERAVRAPHAGVVVEVRARAGEQLRPGAIVASLAGDDSEREVVAFLPGDDQPQMRVGQILRFEVVGYRYAYQNLVVESVGNEAVGPEQARRELGPRLADSIELQGPVVVVHAPLPKTTFESDGRMYEYFDGMHGWAKLRLRQERIIFAIMPGLKRLLERWGAL